MGSATWGKVLADEGTESALFTTLREYPLSSVTVVLAVFLVAIFFITGADSASIVMGMLSQHGKEHPMRWLIIFWGVAQGAVAAVLLFTGGLGALQTLVIIVAGPFMLVIVAMCFSLMKSLRAEPYESTLPSRVRRAVLHAQRMDNLEHQSVALATLGHDVDGDGVPTTTRRTVRGRRPAELSARRSDEERVAEGALAVRSVGVRAVRALQHVFRTLPLIVGVELLVEDAELGAGTAPRGQRTGYPHFPGITPRSRAAIDRSVAG